jgi:hypothetical protein
MHAFAITNHRIPCENGRLPHSSANEYFDLSQPNPSLGTLAQNARNRGASQTVF